MSNLKLSWHAPIIPNREMMGLKLGMTIQQVTQALLACRFDGEITKNTCRIQLPDSPILLLTLENQAIVLLDGEKGQHANERPFEMLVIAFNNDILVQLTAEKSWNADLHDYGGCLFGEVALSTPIKNITKYCQIEFDDVDELFYPLSDSYQGFSIGGSCCSLEEDPDQVASYIRVYKPID